MDKIDVMITIKQLMGAYYENIFKENNFKGI